MASNAGQIYSDYIFIKIPSAIQKQNNKQEAWPQTQISENITIITGDNHNLYLVRDITSPKYPAPIARYIRQNK